jgi:hypothetical protein
MKAALGPTDEARDHSVSINFVGASDTTLSAAEARRR